jgi:hypothetical protein
MTRVSRPVAIAFTFVTLTLITVSSAVAHSDQGTMTAETRPASQQLAVTARARVVFANDGHPANEAGVTVTGTGPGGAQLGSTPLNRVDDGEYEALVSLPAAGDWSLQFTSTNPAASARAISTVRAPESSTPPTLGCGVQARRADKDGDDDSSGPNAAVLAVGGGAVAAAAAVGGAVIARRRR